MKGRNNINMKKHYMIITNERDYLCDLRNNFSFVGFPSRNMNSIKDMKYGDLLVFYITKHSKFVACVEVCGEYFYSNTKVWDDEYDLWPHRIKTRPILFVDKVKKGVFIKDIWENLSFISNKIKWGSQVQGSFRRISESDYDVIFSSIKGKNL